MTKTIDLSIPREHIPGEGTGNPGPCPRCGAPLQKESATYLLLTMRRGQPADSFITGTDKGWFCPQCPALLLNFQELARPLKFGLSKWKVGNEVAVAGIVDLDAIPKSKAELPLGAPGNPIPLVEFTNSGGPAALPGPRQSNHPGSKKRKKRR